jgi:acetyl coenzyme A synthetase (ADP forming)-like protein
MRAQVKNLKYIFEPRSIAVVGASPTPTKVGAVVMKNLIEGKFGGKIYPINPKYEKIGQLTCYPSVIDVKEKIDCAIIAIPAPSVPEVLEQCGKKGIKGVIILSGGFGEVGNKDLEKQVKDIADKYSIAVIGPNCLGILNPYERVDSIFLPMYKLKRPRPGGISFLTQSGATGTCVVDLAAQYGVGISKFISYGNGTVINECDLLEFLENDKKTDQILFYIEGTKDGKRLLEIMKRVNKKKPIVVLKAGRGAKASKAAYSHTGNLAGNYLAYEAAFRQAKVTVADSLDELFEFVKIFNQPKPKGKRIAIITNGGGLGVLTTDVIEEKKLELAEFSDQLKEELRKVIPPYANTDNPLDIIADADSSRYEKTLQIIKESPEVDIIVVIVLFQAPAIDERILNILINASDEKKKPIVVIAVGGEYTDGHRKILDSYGVPTYSSPSDAIKAIKKLVDYALATGGGDG